MRMVWQKRELTALAPSYHDWLAVPSMLSRGQNEWFLLGRSALMLPDEVHVRVEFSPTREGVIQGRGMAP